ncbi:MAG: beta-lactamase family protein [Maribacter sp.]|nr:beta-lactamase family protein [Maribacter sp.]
MKNIACLLVFLACFLSCNKTEDDTTIHDQNQADQTSGSNTGDNFNEPEEPDNPGGNQDNDAANLDDITSGFESVMNIYRIPGAQVAITRFNKIIYLESFGKADIQSNIEVNENSVFRIAAISKPITLTAISKLVSEGNLHLDDLIFGQESLLGTTYGDLPYEDQEESITLYHLIEHMGGFSNDPNDIMFDDNSLTHSDLIAKVLDERSLTYSPGTQYEYSNFGYSLLGRIIEKVSGMAYEDYVKEMILAPMNITGMNISGNTKTDAYENEVTYYSNWMDPYSMNVSRMDSHGGWIASTKDLALFAMNSDLEASVPDLLGPDEGLSYLQSGNWNHNGALPGSLTVMQVNYPISYVVLTNKGESNFQEVIQAIRTYMNDKIGNRQVWPNNDVVNDL